MPDSYWQHGDVQALIDGAGGIAITVGATTANGLRDVEDEQLMQEQSGALIGRVRSALVKTGTFSGLVQGAAITVEGLSCTVISAHQIDDGAITRVRCKKV